MSQLARIQGEQLRQVQPTRLRGEELHVLAGAMDPQVLAALRELGFRVLREHASVATMASRLRASMSGCVVLSVRDEREFEQAAALADFLKRRPGCELVLLPVGDGREAWLGASALTPHCYPAGLPSGVLARLVASVIEAHGAREAREADLPDTVTIRLWDSVEVDGRQVYLGVAERNFLFFLARRPGAVVSKREAIESGPSTHVKASACRRRLGQRLGPALAGLLVPVARFEPYRVREAEEVAAETRGRRRGPVRLRVVGRAGVMVVGGG